MKKSNPRYWDNDKSRALRALTMRLSRLNKRVREQGAEGTDYIQIRHNIKNAREEIYAISREHFDTEARERIFLKYDLIEENDDD